MGDEFEKRRRAEEEKNSIPILPRDAICVGAVLAIGRCPYVCLSHSLCCSETVKDIIKLFPLGSSMVLLLLSQAPPHNSKGNPFIRGVKRGFIKVRKFQPISRYILETVQDRFVVTMELNRKSEAARSRSIRVSSDDHDEWA